MDEILKILFIFWLFAIIISFFVLLLSDAIEYNGYIITILHAIILGSILTVICGIIILIVSIPY